MNLRCFLLAGSALVFGCTHTPEPPPEQQLSVSNAAFKVDRLFTDPAGTTIYRFYDQGEWRYYADNPRTGNTQMLPTTRTVYVDNDPTLYTTTVINTDDHHDHDHGGDHHDGGGHHSH